ncbi:MAG: hypothetical protein QOK43_2629 [Acidimicrobiaceae bacterium]|nr:hypothetical protein [Acidimicrobiaceae bacterium]
MSTVLVHAVSDPKNRPILVVGENVGDRWDLAWALHEAGIVAEQLASAAQAKDRIAHGWLAGVVVDSAMDDDAVEKLVIDLRPDPETGQIPFVLVATRATTPSLVVARVQTLLRSQLEARVNQASWSSEPK